MNPSVAPPGTLIKVTTQETGDCSKVGKRRVGVRTGSSSCDAAAGCDAKEGLN